MILGVLWALWHLMMVDLAGDSFRSLLLMMPFMIAGSLGFSWLWNRTGGSLLIAVLAHVGAHLNNSNRPLGTTITPFVVHTLMWMLFAAAVLVFDRKAFPGPEVRPVRE